MSELPAVDTLLNTMQHDLAAHLQARGIDDPVMVGIHTGGAWIAEQLHQRMNIKAPLGLLDIAFYRDDYDTAGIHPQVHPSHLPFSVDDRHIVLVDDVLYTGRTVRAALNELFDYGRPASVILAVLVDRGEHELPIKADVVGAPIKVAPRESIKLQGPSPLQLTKAAR